MKFIIEDEGYEPLMCPKCNIQMIRRKSNYGDNYWYGCPNFPKCEISASEHPDGSIMSYPADKETKQKRTYAHNLMKRVFGEWTNKEARNQMYDWLEELKGKQTISESHIGKIEGEDLDKVIRLLEHEDLKNYDDPQDETMYDMYCDFPF